MQQVLRAHPAFIVIGGSDRGPDEEITRDWQLEAPALTGVVLADSFFVARYFEERGYHTTHIFCRT